MTIQRRCPTEGGVHVATRCVFLCRCLKKTNKIPPKKHVSAISTNCVRLARLYRRAPRTSWLNNMATYGDESFDSYFYSSYNPYAGRYHKPRDAGWKYNKYISNHADMIEAFNNTQRAQLRSILSQINPKLTPRLRKANTKDVAVQVNPKTDASVQCAIGPRTLLRSEEHTSELQSQR